jgi:8-oxo-dGTP diphosphatase
MKRYATLVRVHMILRSADQVVLTRRAPHLPAGGFWQLPGGHLEEGESVLDAVLRETGEEVGVAVPAEATRFVHVHHHRTFTGATRLALFFEATGWTGEPRNAEPDLCTELRPFPLDAPPRPMVPYIAEALRRYREGERFGLSGWPGR